MATSTIPVSNVAGNNQTMPLGVSAKPIMQPAPTGTIPGATAPTTSTTPAQANNFVPITPGSVLPTVANPGGLTQSSANVAGTTGATTKQLTDIYGKGVGGDLSNLLSSIGGTDSATLQEYIQSLAPEEATASANLGAGLGASGVDPNSSVSAIANANLQSQEFATIAGESANLTQSGQQLEAGILQPMQQAASQEVASSGWDVFGQVMGGAANLAGDVIGAGGKAGGFGNLF
jgi:hypothetical protein